MTVLRVENLRVSYKGEEVLHGVSFTVNAQEKIVIMGPSGSGKTTLLKAIPRLVEPDSGRVIFNGIDVTAIGDDKALREVRSRIGYLPQNYGLFPHMRVVENVALPLRVVKRLPSDKALDIALRYLRLFGVEDLADRYPSQLSGGQQQRVALARTLAMNPDLLLLDEPTSALDPESRIEVLDALYDVVHLGKAMVIVTHEIDFALEVADKIIYMEKGVIAASGDPETVVNSNPSMRRFILKMTRWSTVK